MQRAFKDKANHSNSDYLRRLSAGQIDLLLNEAKDIVFEYLVKLPELTPEIRNSLRQIERKNVCVSCQNKGKYSVAQYPDDFYRSLRQIVKAKREGCPDRELIVRVLQSDKISEALRSPYWKPSFEYEETIADEGEDGLYVWHNEEFRPVKVCFDYYRKVRDVKCPSLEASGTYKDEDGNVVNVDVDFEIDSTYIWRMIVDIAVLLAKRNNDDVTNFQTQLQTILFKQQLKQIN